MKNIHIIVINIVTDEFIKNAKDYNQGDILSYSEKKEFYLIHDILIQKIF